MGCIGTLFRIPFGVMLGYLVMIAAVFAAFSAVMVLAGTDFCFEGDSWVASEKFCVVGVGLFAIAAFLGGFTAIRIGGSASVLFLCILFGGIGSLTALGMLGQGKEVRLKDRPEARPADLGPLQAAQWSETPTWCEWGNLAAGLAGIAVGAAFGRGAPRDSSRAKPKE
ncbi:MAG: hypothetical protein RLY21_1432 [Planctomycetota bacterium]|jgi:hypothetical protein